MTKIKQKQKSSNAKSKEAMRKLRGKIAADPVKHENAKKKERERYYKRIEQGKIKKISGMSDREQRSQRKKWKERSKKYQERKRETKALQKMLDEHTPPPSPGNTRPVVQAVETPRCADNSVNRSGGSRSRLGEKIRRRNRYQQNIQIKALEEKLIAAERRAHKYKKRLQRLKAKTKQYPTEKVKENLNKLDMKSEIKKKALFGEVIHAQLSENFKKQRTTAEKRKFIDNLLGLKIKKYGFVKYIGSVTSNNIIFGKKKYRDAVKHRRLELKNMVKTFFTQDENSRLCAGKRETITFKKIKKQKRYLNDTMKNLHKKFLKMHPDYKMSYAAFCSSRPFWVVQPSISNRNTCLCILHTNMALLISKMKYLKIINESNPQEVVKSLCCDNKYADETCLQRKCERCLDNKIIISEFNAEDSTFYEKWLTKREVQIIKGKQKVCQRTVKQKILCTKYDLTKCFKEMYPKFLLHVRNIYHQYKHTDLIKKQLSYEEVMIHADFSENYLCKYAQEIQSAHFGGSKKQITLHTVVVYYRCPLEHKTKSISYCTLSESLRHDPPAICAHVDLVLQDLAKIVPRMKSLHFLTDGPSTQYRNKTMFFLMVNYLPIKYPIDHLRWHYSESGHGKGAPDGVGGCVKRQADAIIARGVDIPDLPTLVTELKNHLKNVHIIPLQATQIEEIAELVPATLPVFKGTMKTHEVCWSKEKKTFLNARSLTCTACNENIACCHFGLGQMAFRRYDDHRQPSLDSDTTSEDEEGFPVNQDHQKLSYFSIYGDSSDEDAPLSLLENSSKPFCLNQYVLVRLSGKKIFRHYIARIISIDENNEYTVTFLKKNSTQTFSYPEKRDVSVISKSDIIRTMNLPRHSPKTDDYTFMEDLKDIKNLY